MSFRTIGIAVMIGGFIGGQLMGDLELHGAYWLQVSDGGGHAKELAEGMMSMTMFNAIGNIIALVGLVFYVYGSVMTNRRLARVGAHH